MKSQPARMHTPFRLRKDSSRTCSRIAPKLSGCKLIHMSVVLSGGVAGLGLGSSNAETKPTRIRAEHFSGNLPAEICLDQVCVVPGKMLTATSRQSYHADNTSLLACPSADQPVLPIADCSSGRDLHRRDWRHRPPVKLIPKPHLHRICVGDDRTKLRGTSAVASTSEEHETRRTCSACFKPCGSSGRICCLCSWRHQA